MDSETQNEQALIKRINRRLANEGQRLTVSRDTNSLGRYIIVDTQRGNPVAWSDSLDEWAREMGVAS